MTLSIRGFEKIIVAACPNYKANKIQLTGLPSNQVRISFISKGAICFIDISRTDWGFAPWAGHFDNLFKTGKFDTFSYWATYTSHRENDSFVLLQNMTGKSYKSKLALSSKGEYTVHSLEWHDMLKKVREVVENKDVGFKQISKYDYKGA